MVLKKAGTCKWDPAHRKVGTLPVDTKESSAPLAHPSTEECFVCYDGLVYIGSLEMTEEGEEIEVVEPVPRRRCAR